MSRHVPRIALVLVSLVAGAVLTTVVWGSGASAPTTRPPAVSTARVVRTTLATAVLTEGTLGYAQAQPVVNRMAGTYTALPTGGDTIEPGGTLYRVDNRPAVLMSGTTPAWRDIGPGIGDGPDVAALDTNLIAEGYGVALGAPSPHFTPATQQAVRRWQASEGYPASGQVLLGQVVFLPGPVLVGAPNVTLGQAANPGDLPYAVTGPSRTVSVPITPNLPDVTVGDAVSVVLPSNVTVPSTVTQVGVPGPVGAPGSSQSSGSATGSSSGAQTGPTITVVPDHPEQTGTEAGVAVEVSFTSQLEHDVLAAPVTSLLALAGGGYGVEVVEPDGAHRLVRVTTGLFADSQVAVSGSGIRRGTKVVVAQ